MNKYIENFSFGINALDANGKIKPSAVFNAFQNAASRHADALGVGFDKLAEQDLVWVLIRCRYDIIAAPPSETPLSVETYPLAPNGIDFDREYVIRDKSGNKLIIGNSKWCFCNCKTRRLALRTNIKYNDENFVKTREYDGGLKKIPPFSTDGFDLFHSKTTFTDLDKNGHVNNARYLDFILDALSADGAIDVKSLEINYVSEMKANSEFDVYYKKDDSAYLVAAKTDDKDSFRAVVELKG